MDKDEFYKWLGVKDVMVVVFVVMWMLVIMLLFGGFMLVVVLLKCYIDKWIVMFVLSKVGIKLKIVFIVNMVVVVVVLMLISNVVVLVLCFGIIEFMFWNLFLGLDMFKVVIIGIVLVLNIGGMFLFIVLL